MHKHKSQCKILSQMFNNKYQIRKDNREYIIQLNLNLKQIENKNWNLNLKLDSFLLSLVFVLINMLFE